MRSAVTVAVGGRRPITANIATDLPEPDSPTIASTSLRSSVSVEPVHRRERALRCVANETVRLRISSSGMKERKEAIELVLKKAYSD